jgi:hypothetical protein
VHRSDTEDGEKTRAGAGGKYKKIELRWGLRGVEPDWFAGDVIGMDSTTRALVAARSAAFRYGSLRRAVSPVPARNTNPGKFAYPGHWCVRYLMGWWGGCGRQKI